MIHIATRGEVGGVPEASNSSPNSQRRGVGQDMAVPKLKTNILLQSIS